MLTNIYSLSVACGSNFCGPHSPQSGWGEGDTGMKQKLRSLQVQGSQPSQAWGESRDSGDQSGTEPLYLGRGNPSSPT